MAKRKRESASAPGDFSDEHSQRVLDALARAVASELGRKAADEQFDRVMATARKNAERSAAGADGYLSLRALAGYSDMSVRTLRSYMARRTNPIPHYRMAGKILVRRSEFDVWMRGFRVDETGSLSTMVDDVMKGLSESPRATRSRKKAKR